VSGNHHIHVSVANPNIRPLLTLARPRASAGIILEVGWWLAASYWLALLDSTSGDFPVDDLEVLVDIGSCTSVVVSESDWPFSSSSSFSCRTFHDFN